MDRIAALRLFIRVAERGSFSAAARELQIKQSTASKWVAELESEVGVTLIERTTRAVRVTGAGQRFILRAREVLAAFDELGAEFAERGAVPRGRIRASVPVVFGNRFVVPAVGDFLRQHPQVSIELVMSERYVNLVDEGFDLAIRVGIPIDTSARGLKLADGRRVLVAAPSYLKSRGEPVRPRDLRDHECLVHGDSTVWRFGGKPVAVRGRFTANSSAAVAAMARKGLGLALLADWLVGEDLERGRLVPVLEGFPAPPAPVYALSPPGRFASTTVRALIDHLAAAISLHLGRSQRTGA